MPPTVKLAAEPSWPVLPMTLEQIPLVVAWLAALDSDTEMDQIGLADRMQREMVQAKTVGIYEYCIGYFEKLATFYLVGAVVQSSLPGLEPNPTGNHDYEISTLLISPLITEELHFMIFHQAVKYTLTSTAVTRVIYQVDSDNDQHRTILARLGFQNEGYVNATLSHCWYTCLRDDFLKTVL